MSDWGIPGVVSERFFGPPFEGYEEPEVGPELRAACGWFKSFMATGEWERRRIEVAKRFYKASLGEIEGVEDSGRFFRKTDSFAWYLFLCESILEHPWNYEPIFGSRVIPVFAAIGRNLPVLSNVSGVADRVRRIVGSEMAQPNGGLFELLVAGAYCRAGGRVTLLDERPGVARTHDMDVELHGRHWAIECKRMETSDYGERERQRLRELWGPSSAYLSRIERSTIGNVEFKVEIRDVPDNYLTNRTKTFLACGRTSILWDDEFASGSMGDIDLEPLQAVLATDDVMICSSRMQELLTGCYVRNRNMLQALRCQSGASSRFAGKCDLAIVLNWDCLAEAAIAAKARAITTKVSQANDQLPDGIPSIVHVGFETVDGDAVEAARYQKIIQGISAFDPRGKNLEYVYCHYFAPESPPDGFFAFDETTQWLSVRPTGPRPLEIGNLVSSENVAWREGGHWE